MKKITFLIACFVASIGFMNAQSSRTIAEMPNADNNPERTVQLPAAYFNSTVSAVGETTGVTSNNEIDTDLRVPFTGTYYFQSPDAIVYDNGPYFNVAGPPDISFLQDASLGMGTYGFGAQFTAGNSMADDVVLTDSYDITSIDVFAYQTGSSAPSINALYLQVWDGDPSGGGASVIWGDLTTDILDTATATDAFRQLESAPGDTAREIQRANGLTTGLSLTAGTYWIEYAFEGSGASGPWAPPIVITGNATTGNALQNISGTYAPVIDVGPQGMPFVMYGDLVGGGGCDEENPNDFTFENGINCSSASAFQTANDVTVAADENFTLTNITASIFANGGIINVDVNYYDNAGGLPGTLIGSEASVTIDNQTVIGSNFGLDVNEVEMTVTPFVFAGQAGVPTTYWIELSVTDSGVTGTVYWVVTSSTSVGNPTALYDSGWSYFDPALDGVYIWGGDCNPLSIEENSLAGFSYYPNPTNGILSLKSVSNIDSVAMYNLLGQQVLSSKIGATTSDLDISGLTTGAYIMKVTVDGQIGTYKVLKN